MKDGSRTNQYEGQYFNDKKHGVGFFEWESGNTYAGNYKADERSGFGVMRWTDGSIYLGMWEQGIQSGIGVMIFPDKKTRAGFFQNNVFMKSLQNKSEIDPFRKFLSPDCIRHMENFIGTESSLSRNDESPRSPGVVTESKSLDFVSREVQRIKQ